jgi:hypothetical protein
MALRSLLHLMGQELLLPLMAGAVLSDVEQRVIDIGFLKGFV